MYWIIVIVINILLIIVAVRQDLREWRIDSCLQKSTNRKKQ